MTCFSIRCVAIMSWLVFGVGAAHGAEPISIESLLREMVDRDSLARFPAPLYTCRQASSYDRDSVSPEEQETWYANWDRSQFIRTEEKDDRKEYVMLDADGPGAVVRFWGTWHGPGGGDFSNGTLRVYLDHEEEPVIEGPIRDMISGGRLVGSPLSRFVSETCPEGNRAHNLYLPIPYAKHCKITYSTDVLVDRGAKKGEALYYQINYRTYAKGVDVESFSMDQLADAESIVETVNQQLGEGRRDADGDWKVNEANGEVEAGGSTESIRIDGPGAIRSMRYRLEADDLEQALRSTVLEIKFDGEQTVWCPIGDFCGSGYKVSPHKTWYTHVDESGHMECAWVMPFESKAVITIHNLGTQPVRIVDGSIKHIDWQWDDRSMHFHATWRQLTQVITRGGNGMTGEGASDVNYVTAHGKGVYVGDTLTLCNGAAKWWGEGDEKIYVDGEKFPSHFGTGTEDYYGYAWCRPEPFSSPFHAQPEGGGNMTGGFSVNSRYRGLDAIPFSKSIQFDMELWHWASTKMNYAPATFFYARPGATCNVKPDPTSVAMPVAKVREDVAPIFKVTGAIEGESLKVVDRTGGTTQPQSANFGWSGDAQLWWIDGKVGDKLVVEFPVEKAGEYKVSANLTKADDYAIVQMTVNDDPSKKIDRYHPEVKHDLLKLGTFDLEQGANRLTIEIVGKNKEAIPRQMFGLDYLKLE